MLKKAIIYGATGAIGQALIRALLQNDVQVLALGRPDGRLHALTPRQGLTCRLCTLRELATLENHEQAPFDMFFHLGWAGTTGHARSDAALQLANVQATLDAVQAAKRLGCHTFIGAGSQAEYGPKSVPLTPTTPPFPQNAYGAAKLAAGLLSRESAKRLQIQHIWVRILSVYGPHDGENALFSYLARELLAGRTPQLTDGQQLWDYLFADDAADALYKIAKQGKDGATYVLGHGSAAPLHTYIEEMRDLLRPDATLDFGKMERAPDAPTYLCADITALQRDTGWQPATPFAAGAALTAAFLREKYASRPQAALL